MPLALPDVVSLLVGCFNRVAGKGGRPGRIHLWLEPKPDAALLPVLRKVASELACVSYSVCYSVLPVCVTVCCLCVTVCCLCVLQCAAGWDQCSAGPGTRSATRNGRSFLSSLTRADCCAAQYQTRNLVQKIAHDWLRKRVVVGRSSLCFP